MSRIQKLNHFVRSSGRMLQNLIKNPSVKSCLACTHRLLLTNIIALRATEKVILRRFFSRFSSRGTLKVQRLLLGACFFSWAEDRITDEEMHRSLGTMLETPSISLLSNCTEDRNTSAENSSSTNVNVDKCPLENIMNETSQIPRDSEWEEIVSREGFHLWRRPIPDTELFEYKVHGVIKDIPPLAFYSVQLDLQYRRSWDNKIVELDVIDQDDDTDSEVVHWVTKFPYPMADREYIYVRRHHFDRHQQSGIIMSRIIPDHPAVSVPEERGVVRVTTYESVMVIKAHSSFDQNGFDYYLTYADDPKASFPSFAYKWMATHGLPAFLDDVHRAAIALHEQGLYDKMYF